VTGSEGDAIKFAIREVDFLDVQQGKLPPKKWGSLRRDLRTLSKRPRVVPLLKELVEFDGLWDSMALAQFHLPTDVATRFPVEISHYLSTLLDRWRFTTHHPDSKEAKFRLDSVSAEFLAGTLAGCSSAGSGPSGYTLYPGGLPAVCRDAGARMTIKRSMLDLDGRILTLSVFLDHELPLLKQVADIQPAEESRSPSYADF
jgi:hypothetical protein